MRRVVVLVALVALLASACASSKKEAVVNLDGSPRLPDTEGVVLKASSSAITLDGNRHYTITKSLIAFSTYNRRAVALSSTVGSYVQLGLDKREVQWLGRIGVVNADEAGHQTVQYQGDLVRVQGTQFVFRDGTVLRLAPGLTPPPNPRGQTYVVLDAKRHLIQGATFQAANTTTTRSPKS